MGVSNSMDTAVEFNVYKKIVCEVRLEVCEKNGIEFYYN